MKLYLTKQWLTFLIIANKNIISVNLDNDLYLELLKTDIQYIHSFSINEDEYIDLVLEYSMKHPNKIHNLYLTTRNLTMQYEPKIRKK